MTNANKIKAGEAFIVLRALDKASPVLKKFARNFMDVGRDIRNFGAGILATGALITSAFIKPIKIASEVTEQQNKFFQVFGTKVGKEVEDRMREIGRETGRTTLKMYKFTSAFGGMLKGQGATTEQAAEMSKALLKLGIDFSSFNDIMDDTREGSMRRFVSALSGSAEVLDQYGVTAKESAVGPMLEQMFGVGIRGANDLQKSLARAALIFRSIEQQNALDDAIRTREELANAWRNFSDLLYEVQYHIGMALLPIVGKVVQYLIKAGQEVNKWVQNNKNLIIAIGLVGVGLTVIGGIITAIGFGAMFVGAVLFGISQILVVIKVVLVAIGAVISFITGNLLVIVAILGALGAALALWLVIGTQIVNVFQEFFSWVTIIGQAIWKAFSTGRFELAWKIFFETLKYGWMGVKFFVENIIRQVRAALEVGARRIADAIVSAFDVAGTALGSVWLAFFSMLARQLQGMLYTASKVADLVPGMGKKSDMLRTAALEVRNVARAAEQEQLDRFQQLRSRMAGRVSRTRERTSELASEWLDWKKVQEAALAEQWGTVYELIKEANKPQTDDDPIIPNEPDPSGTGAGRPVDLTKTTLPEALEKGTLAAAKAGYKNAQTQALNDLVSQGEEAERDRKDGNAILQEMLESTGAVP